MAHFGDYEPEDAWHPEDLFEDLARNLRQRIALLDEALHIAAGVWRAYDEPGQVEELTERLRVHIDRRAEHTTRSLVRIRQLREDIGLLRSRLIT